MGIGHAGSGAAAQGMASSASAQGQASVGGIGPGAGSVGGGAAGQGAGHFVRLDDDINTVPKGDVSGMMQSSTSVAQPVGPDAEAVLRREAQNLLRRNASSNSDAGFDEREPTGLGG